MEAHELVEGMFWGAGVGFALCATVFTPAPVAPAVLLLFIGGASLYVLHPLIGGTRWTL